MKGISYITDDNNHKQAVVIDLKKHRSMWEDFYDYMIALSRKDEEKIPMNKVISKLKKAGKLKRDV